MLAERMSRGDTTLLLQPGLSYLRYSNSCTARYITDCINEQDRMLVNNDLKDEINQLSISADNQQCCGKIPQKKRVSFADSVGLELVQIRHMTAGRDTPPIIDPKVLASLNVTKDNSHIPKLTLGFQQPVSDYYRFTQTLQLNNVSLESVSINDNVIIGTVKVKNLAYQKSVSIHVTYDNWSTVEDCPAYYVNNGLIGAQGNQIRSVIDTFSFTLETPVHKLSGYHGLHFAVCFTCEGQQFWDNNNGKNYIIDVQSPMTNGRHGFSRPGVKSPYSRFSHQQETSWTEFAIWKSLESDFTPYW